MYESNFPKTYEEWRHCITVECGLELTPEYISERISALQNDGDYHTQRFVELYGQQHLQQVLDWFIQAQKMGSTTTQ